MLGPTLTRLRRQRKLTQTALAKRVHVTQSYISQLESNADENPTTEVLRRLAKALRVGVSELLR